MKGSIPHIYKYNRELFGSGVFGYIGNRLTVMENNTQYEGDRGLLYGACTGVAIVLAGHCMHDN